MQISILGCGWLGMPLGISLVERGHEAKGSTTTPDKKSKLARRGIEPYLLELTPELTLPENIHSFWKSDVLVLNVPPGRGRDDIVTYHSRQIHAVISEVGPSSIQHVIFISSTSVYPDKPGQVSEGDAIPGQAGRASGNALLQAERLLLESSEFDTTVLRFGGLIGGDRHPAKYLAGRKNLSKPTAPVNLIHRDDCIGIITQLIEERMTGEVFNAVADAHPARKEYYTQAAKEMGLEPPEFLAPPGDDTQHKIVSTQKLKQRLGYQFRHPGLKV